MGSPPLSPPPAFCMQPGPSSPFPASPASSKEAAACARVNGIQVINRLQQLAPAPGPADVQALKGEANYSLMCTLLSRGGGPLASICVSSGLCSHPNICRRPNIAEIIRSKSQRWLTFSVVRVKALAQRSKAPPKMWTR